MIRSYASQLIEACNVIVYLRANVFLLIEPKIVSDRERYIDGLLLYKRPGRMNQIVPRWGLYKQSLTVCTIF